MAMLPLEYLMKDLVISLYLALVQLAVLLINTFILVFNGIRWLILTVVISLLKVFLHLFDKGDK